jgi:hypothetical protein
MANNSLTLDSFTDQLRQLHGAALQCIVLYGSAAADEQLKGHSDLNVLVIVQSLSLETLQKLGQTVRAWNEAGNPAPLTLTSSEWRRSSDIFPMEYADILERHRVLYGTAPFDGITVRPEDLRLQTEQEAMGKLLRLRQGVMTAGANAERQRDLLRVSFSSILVIFRALVRLTGNVPPRDRMALISSVASRAGFDGTGFEKVESMLKGNQLGDADTASTLASYVQGMEALVAHLDSFTPPANGGTLNR